MRLKSKAKFIIHVFWNVTFVAHRVVFDDSKKRDAIVFEGHEVQPEEPAREKPLPTIHQPVKICAYVRITTIFSRLGPLYPRRRRHYVLPKCRQPFTQRHLHIPEDLHLQQHGREILSRLAQQLYLCRKFLSVCPDYCLVTRFSLAYIQVSEEYAAFIYRVEVSRMKASSDCVARLQRGGLVSYR